MKKLSIRNRGGFNFEVGPTNGGKSKNAKTVMVSAKDKREALQLGRPLWKDKYDTRATRVAG